MLGPMDCSELIKVDHFPPEAIENIYKIASKQEDDAMKAQMLYWFLKPQGALKYVLDHRQEDIIMAAKKPAAAKQ
jgi:hypothetical protein